MEYITHSLAETEELGCRLGRTLGPGAVVAYFGGLGMGKTAFTRGLARGLGCRGRVTSPTFAIVNEYEGGRLPLFHFDMYRLNSATFTIVNEYDGPTPLFHFDMYRLADADALFDIGWEDYLDRGGVCAVEWSENVREALPPDAVTVTIARCPENDSWRSITIEGGEPL